MKKKEEKEERNKEGKTRQKSEKGIGGESKEGRWPLNKLK